MGFLPSSCLQVDQRKKKTNFMQSCIGDINAWGTANMLKLNDYKTELMLVTSKKTRHLYNLPTLITIGNSLIPYKHSVKNLCFKLECHLTMNVHVTNVARTCYFKLRRFASIRRFLTRKANATLVSAFVLSRIDCCDSLLFRFTHDIASRHIQNSLFVLPLPQQYCTIICH